MPKARDYHLTAEELMVVETAIHRDKRPEVRQRATSIRLLHLDHKPGEVAEIQAVSIPTIYGWIERWRDGGVEALANRPKSGRPLKADDEYSRTLEEDRQRTRRAWVRFCHLDLGSLARPHEEGDRD